MLTITNNSSNPLPLSGGGRLVPGESTRAKELDDRLKGYDKRGWLSVIEDPKPESKVPEKTEGGSSK